MQNKINRRNFMKLAGVGGVVFVSGLGFDVMASQDGNSAMFKDFFFVQLSDTHWGFNGPLINPNADKTLLLAIENINRLHHQPDFIVFTGDLTHTTDDPQERRRRMQAFREIVDKLRVKNIKFLPGEHDASLDKGEAYQEFFGDLHYSFDHKGIHFIALDNVSDAGAILGQAQLDWLKTDLQQLHHDTPIVVLTHRPLFDLYAQWDWNTRDGQLAINLLLPYKNVAVFYGHIHQEHIYVTEHIIHYAANSLIFPLPAPGLAPKRAPIPWNENKPYAGLGYRQIESFSKKKTYSIDEIGIGKGELA